MAAPKPVHAVDAELRVLVCAPFRRDSALIREILRHQGIESLIVDLDDADNDSLADHGAVLICTQEGLTHKLRARLLDVVDAQPSWASLPIVFLLDIDADSDAIMSELGDLLVKGHVMVLHRPVRPLEFRTAVSNALATRRRQLETRNHLAYQTELQRELNHRVKNTLATFVAIYRMSLRQSTTLDDFAARFGSRVEALTAVHTLLDETRNDGSGLAELVSGVLAPYEGDQADRFEIAGPPVKLQRNAGFALALILNELATNAVKYGALSQSQGRVAVSWTSEADGAMALDWRERGGPAVKTPEKPGYGTRFIEGSVRGIAGECSFDYAADGLRFRMTLPSG
ncbi:sensor histidine kinase [Consotaella aegiceratis]|uniref:sensor histidine kinase n=1 Tax=Consotaella aegiceratis TaxID=3097961 RepID=UPI002F41E7FB